MKLDELVQFLSGAVTITFVIASWHFVRFWKKTHDRLFLHFAVAFGLFAANQIAAAMLDVSDERRGLSYVLRVLGYVLILTAIVDKNVFRRRRRS